MRFGPIVLAFCLVAGCSKAPESEGPGEATSRAQGVAFSYDYDFTLPSKRIADAQEAHAQACERLGPDRCRITGMSYTLDRFGKAEAGLQVRLAAPLARRFGRVGIETVERAGGALTHARILGEDMTETSAAGTRTKVETSEDLAELDRQLAAKNLPGGLRRDLIVRRIELVSRQREGQQALAAATASVATTPMAFSYRAGSGTGLAARLSEAGEAGLASLGLVLGAALLVLAYAGPPLVLVLAVALLWRRFGRRLWERLVAATEPR